jgi:hypothetical protein
MVRVALSLGPQPTTTTVPNVVGQQEVLATATLGSWELVKGTVSRVFSNRPEGEVLGQSPLPGTVVNIGSAVNLTVSKGPENPDALVVTITAPVDNFVGTVGQSIPFSCTVTGGVGSYDNFKWHFPDNSFKYQQNVTKTFDFPGAGWCYIDVTDHAGTVAQDKVWVQINSPVKSSYQGRIFWLGQVYEFGSWPAEAKAALGL